MIDIEKILDYAIKKDASDIHFICGNKPMLRIIRELVEVSDCDVLSPDDMNEIYDYLIRGNIDKDNVYKETKKLDTSLEYAGKRFRVNISSSEDIPLFTLRIIKNELPKYEDLGVPKSRDPSSTYPPSGVSAAPPAKPPTLPPRAESTRLPWPWPRNWLLPASRSMPSPAAPSTQT